jgi:hypothetical protein
MDTGSLHTREGCAQAERSDPAALAGSRLKSQPDDLAVSWTIRPPLGVAVKVL